jgi:uncharacterized membrane protein YqhA
MQLIGSIIAVSTVNILRVVVEIADGGDIDKARFTWIIAFHGVFLASALSVAVVNKLYPHTEWRRESQET